MQVGLNPRQAPRHPGVGRVLILGVLALSVGCSLLNREGPTVTCQELGNGATNACKDGILATCSGGTVSYNVCDDKSACDGAWQTVGRYRCAERDAPPTSTDGGQPPGPSTASDGGACGGPVPCVVASGGVYDLALEGSSVYFHGCATLSRVAKTGGVVTPLATGLTGCAARGIFIDATDVYVMNGTAGLSRVPKGGGTFTRALPPTPAPTLFAIDVANVYWTAGSVDVLKSVPKAAGGAISPLTTNTDFDQNARMLVEGGFVYWVGTGTNLSRVAATATGPTAPSSIYLGQPAADFVVDGDDVYFVGTGGVWATSLSGGTPRQLASQSAATIALDATNAYFAGARSITKVPRAGGSPSTVATTTSPIETRIAVDETSVYWGESGKIMRVAK